MNIDKISQACDKFHKLAQAAEAELAQAQSMKTAPEVLAQLAQSPDQNVRSAVAINANASPETLDALSQDQSPYVKISVIFNPSTPAASLARLAQDPSKFVRYNMISGWDSISSKLSKDVLASIPFADFSPSAKKMLIKGDLPEQILFALAKDKDPSVRVDALAKLKALGYDVSGYEQVSNIHNKVRQMAG